MRVERLDDNFAKTGNIALSNGSKMSQQPVLDDIHVLGIRAWLAGRLAGQERPGRALARGMRGREGWGGRSALVRDYVVDKRKLTRTLQSVGARREKESGWPMVPTWQSRSFLGAESRKCQRAVTPTVTSAFPN